MRKIVWPAYAVSHRPEPENDYIPRPCAHPSHMCRTTYWAATGPRVTPESAAVLIAELGFWGSLRARMTGPEMATEACARGKANWHKI